MVLNNNFNWRSSPVVVGVVAIHLLALYLAVRTFVATTPPQIIQPSLMFATLSEPEPQAKPQAEPAPQPKPQPAKPKTETAKQQAKPAPKPVAKTTTSDKALHESRPAEPQVAAEQSAAAPEVTKAAAPVAVPAVTAESSRLVPAGNATGPKPYYPPQSRALGEEGTVLLRVKVGTDGMPISVEVAKSSGFPRLDESAKKTVKNSWKFVPARRGNEAVVDTVLQPVRFGLEN